MIFFVKTSFSLSQQRFPELTGEYLGQKQPGNTPNRFAEVIFGKERKLHSCPVFSPDGDEVYWSQMNKGSEGIYYMKRNKNKWSAPEKPPFLSMYRFTDVPCFSPDGKRLYFIVQSETDYDEDIMYMEQKEGKWSLPQSVGKEINDMNLHWQISVNGNMDIYFQVRNEELSDGDIYMAEFENGKYRKPERLGNTINTEAWEQFPYIFPDGSYLIFVRQTGSNGYDIFISFRKKNGKWGKAVNIGESINAPYDELWPNVTPDGKYLFYMGRRNSESGIFWVRTEFIEALRKADKK